MCPLNSKVSELGGRPLMSKSLQITAAASLGDSSEPVWRPFPTASTLGGQPRPGPRWQTVCACQSTRS